MGDRSIHESAAVLSYVETDRSSLVNSKRSECEAGSPFFISNGTFYGSASRARNSSNKQVRTDGNPPVYPLYLSKNARDSSGLPSVNALTKQELLKFFGGVDVHAIVGGRNPQSAHSKMVSALMSAYLMLTVAPANGLRFTGFKSIYTEPCSMIVRQYGFCTFPSQPCIKGGIAVLDSNIEQVIREYNISNKVKSPFIYMKKYQCTNKEDCEFLGNNKCKRDLLTPVKVFPHFTAMVDNHHAYMLANKGVERYTFPDYKGHPIIMKCDDIMSLLYAGSIHYGNTLHFEPLLYAGKLGFLSLFIDIDIVKQAADKIFIVYNNGGANMNLFDTLKFLNDNIIALVEYIHNNTKKSDHEKAVDSSIVEDLIIRLLLDKIDVADTDTMTESVMKKIEHLIMLPQDKLDKCANHVKAVVGGINKECSNIVAGFKYIYNLFRTFNYTPESYGFDTMFVSFIKFVLTCLDINNIGAIGDDKKKNVIHHIVTQYVIYCLRITMARMVPDANVVSLYPMSHRFRGTCLLTSQYNTPHVSSTPYAANPLSRYIANKMCHDMLLKPTYTSSVPTNDISPIASIQSAKKKNIKCSNKCGSHNGFDASKQLSVPIIISNNSVYAKYGVICVKNPTKNATLLAHLRTMSHEDVYKYIEERCIIEFGTIWPSANDATYAQIDMSHDNKLSVADACSSVTKGLDKRASVRVPMNEREMTVYRNKLMAEYNIADNISYSPLRPNYTNTLIEIESVDKKGNSIRNTQLYKNILSLFLDNTHSSDNIYFIIPIIPTVETGHKLTTICGLNVTAHSHTPRGVEYIITRDDKNDCVLVPDVGNMMTKGPLQSVAPYSVSSMFITSQSASDNRVAIIPSKHRVHMSRNV